MPKNLEIGNIYIQRPLFKPLCFDTLDREFIVITEVKDDNILFDLYFKDPQSGLLNKSPGEGKISQLEEGFQGGDIEKTDEAEFIAWQTQLLLIEKEKEH